MIVVQNAPFEISILCIETSDQVTLMPGEHTEVDGKTGAYLVGMRAFDQSGVLMTDVSEVS